MTKTANTDPNSLLLMIAGINGAVGSTLAAAAAAWRHSPKMVAPYLTIPHYLPGLAERTRVHAAGWDRQTAPLSETVDAQGVLPAGIAGPLVDDLAAIPVRGVPAAQDLSAHVAALAADIDDWRRQYPQSRPVLVNLLPACSPPEGIEALSLTALLERMAPDEFPDLAFVLAALRSGVPVVNFTPNAVELPCVCSEARKQGVPICGRDGKTGQTYFKVVLASAFKARGLDVDGWYSLNILGNADGANLMDPCRAAGKLANKTELLDNILGYPVGRRYGTTSHTVRIDYYAPRGDAKEAWDVIDFRGLFDLPMGLRVNLQGRDSILAAPLALDLAIWTAALQRTGRSGPVPELAFYFKRPVGEAAPVTFQDQVNTLVELAGICRD